MSRAPNFVRPVRCSAVRSRRPNSQAIRGMASEPAKGEPKPAASGTSADWSSNSQSSGRSAGTEVESEAAAGSTPSISSDEQAQRWLDAMSASRAKWKPDGTPFDVNRAFAPTGMDDEFDFWAAADAEIEMQERSARFEGTPEQIAEAEALKDVPIPAKRDRWMNMLVNKVMRKGDKAKAYKIVNRAMYFAFSKSRTDPVEPSSAALDRMAPLVQSHRIGDGGARSELFPVPYSEMRRIAKAWSWVIEASQNRQSSDFAVRLGEEVVATIEGRSPGFAKGEAIHKTAIANRSIAEEVQQGRWKR